MAHLDSPLFHEEPVFVAAPKTGKLVMSVRGSEILGGEPHLCFNCEVG